MELIQIITRLKESRKLLDKQRDLLNKQIAELEKQINVSNNTNGHEFVDLGLPSGRLWATCNVGASKPEEYGDYFAWGETEPKEEYNWSTYKHGDDWDNLFKYNKTDGKTVLNPEDDAVHINMGGDWRMPTKEDFEELIESTTNECTTVSVCVVSYNSRH